MTLRWFDVVVGCVNIRNQHMERDCSVIRYPLPATTVDRSRNNGGRPARSLAVVVSSDINSRIFIFRIQYNIITMLPSLGLYKIILIDKNCKLELKRLPSSSLSQSDTEVFYSRKTH